MGESRGTITGPEEFDGEAACQKLFEGMKGLGTEENVLVEIIGGHTNEQRQEIKEKYLTMFGKNLMEELEGELGGTFATVVLALMKSPEEYLVECVHQAIEGLGTDEYALIGLLCTRTNEELETLKSAYQEKYEKSMEEDVSEDLSGDFKNLIVGIMNGGRDEGEEIDQEKVEEDTKKLHEASDGAGTSEEVYQSIFNTRSYGHMRAVFEAFKEVSDGKEIEEVIESEFSGSIQAAYLALCKIFRDKHEFYADRIRQAIKGAGTDDETLIRLLVSRSEIDLKDIIEKYDEKFESSLLNDVIGDTSGDYGSMLKRILGGPEADAAQEAEGQEEVAPEEDAEGEATEEGGGAEEPAEDVEEQAEEEE